MQRPVRLALFLLAALFPSRHAAAAPPLDPAARKTYDHNYKWLANMHTGFIAINIRGENDQQYPERRQAALDIIKEKHDLTAVPELIDELQRGSFLSGDICDILGDWKAKKALPALREISADEKRPADVRAKAAQAIKNINIPSPEAPRPTY